MYGEENLRAAWSAGNGVVVALPHVGSWEWGAAWLALEGMPMTAVVERLKPEQLFEWFLAQRAAMGLTGIPLGEKAGPATLQAIKSGQIVGLVSDRDLSGTGVEVTFFGERTRLPGGAVTMALRTGAALLPGAVYMGPGNWHTGVVHPPLDTTRRGTMREDVTRLTQELATIFEGYIRRAPEQWHLYQPNWPSDRVGAGESVAGESVAGESVAGGPA
jgi:KDO2-lipid IV(A) lauroyltransferase